MTSYQIKVLALVIMTIDHVGAYGFTISVVEEHYTLLRIIGRIAAPLFLLMIAESVRYTKNKSRYVARLYIAGVCVGLFTAITNFFFRDSFGIHTLGNILFTFLYTALYIVLIDWAIKAFKEKQIQRLLLCIAGLAATFLPHLLFTWTYGPDSWIPAHISSRYLRLLLDLFDSVIVSPLQIEYSLMFVLLGIVFYFFPKKETRCIMFAVFCAVCFFGTLMQTTASPWSFNDFFNIYQVWMLLALPFIWLYNGQRGKGHKLFFYVYYPLHRYAIIVLAYLAS